jgi:hypothetical protein
MVAAAFDWMKLPCRGETTPSRMRLVTRLRTNKKLKIFLRPSELPVVGRGHTVLEKFNRDRPVPAQFWELTVQPCRLYLSDLTRLASPTSGNPSSLLPIANTFDGNASRSGAGSDSEMETGTAGASPAVNHHLNDLLSLCRGRGDRCMRERERPRR